MLWESIPILRRIFQGFEEANPAPHALKQIEKENPVNNFWARSFSEKCPGKTELIFGSIPPTKAGT